MAGNTTAPEPSNQMTAAAAFQKNGTFFGVGECFVMVRQAFGFSNPLPGAASAAQAYNTAKLSGAKFEKSGATPVGLPVYWTGGKSGAGHIAILTDNNGGVLTTDFDDNGYVGDGKVHVSSIAVISKDKNLQFQGWSDHLAGTPVSPTSWPAGSPSILSAAGKALTFDFSGAASEGTSAIAQGVIGGITSAFKSLFTADWFLRAAAGLGGMILVLIALYKMTGSPAITPLPLPV